MPGELPFATQPIPALPEAFTRQSFTAEDLRVDVANREKILALVKESRTGKPYLPITRQRTIVFPGTDGGAQWGGAAIDCEIVGELEKVLIALGGIWFFLFTRELRTRSLLPDREPGLKEALGHG